MTDNELNETRILAARIRTDAEALVGDYAGYASVSIRDLDLLTFMLGPPAPGTSSSRDINDQTLRLRGIGHTLERLATEAFSVAADFNKHTGPLLLIEKLRSDLDSEDPKISSKAALRVLKGAGLFKRRKR